MGTVTGWGTTSEGGSLASILQKVDVPVVSDDHCRDSYGQNDIADSMTALDLTREARTPVRVTPVAHSCAETSSPELFLGDMDVLRLDTPVSTLRLLTLWAG